MINKTLSELKFGAHRAFDVFWRSGYEHRSVSYAWMRRQIGKEHISHLSRGECVTLIELCEFRKHKIGLRFSVANDKAPWMMRRLKNRRVEAMSAADAFCDIEEEYCTNF